MNLCPNCGRPCDNHDPLCSKPECGACGEPMNEADQITVVKFGREWYVCDKCRERMCQGEGAGYVEL